MLLIVLTAVLGCASSGCTAPAESVPAAAEFQACETVKSAVVADGRYTRSQVAGCDAEDADRLPGYITLRLDSYCREEVCGSVLLGWFAVESESNRVFDWIPGEETVGSELSPET